MTLKLKLESVPDIVDRLWGDPNFQYGKSWSGVDDRYGLRCIDLITVAYQEAGISPQELSFPPHESKPEEILDNFLYDSFEEVPVGHFLCTRHPRYDHSNEYNYPFTHAAIKYSDTHIASLSLRNEPLSISHCLELLSQQVFVSSSVLRALEIDDKDRFYFPKGFAREQISRAVNTLIGGVKLPALMEQN